MPRVQDQLQLGSCTANAIAAAIDYERGRQGLRFMYPSRLFIYYNERDMEQTIDSDAGAVIRDGLKSVAAQGVCVESFWPYVDDGFRFAVKPNPVCYSTALSHQTIKYLSPNPDLLNLKTGLAAKWPFVFGFSVYESFMSNQVSNTGMVPMPARNESLIGGHAVLAVGYDDSKNAFLFRNSWGTEWGLGGYAWIPYAYVTDPNLADDFWSIRLVEQ
jgi:C1A family cysteine protease